MEQIHINHMITVKSKFGLKRVLDPEYLDGIVKIEKRKEGIIWDHIVAAVNVDKPRKVTFFFGPLDAIKTYVLFGTDFEWYGIKSKALRRLKL
jgi:hypothetical protein